MTTIPEEIADMEAGLKAERERWTAEALCRRAGINRSTWTRWKNENAEPKLRTWRKVLAAYEEMTGKDGAS